MSKIIPLTLVLILMAFSHQAYAEIGKEVDNFDNTTSIYSEIAGQGPWETVKFDITREKDGRKKYFLTLTKIDPEWWFFDNRPVGVKIEKKIYGIPCIETDSKTLVGNKLVTSGRFLVERKTIRRIKKAEALTIRVYSSNNPSITWEVPYHALAEWKIVISRAKEI